ncbi:MAG: 23S rRNA methyltransferase [Ghiorsea sp.]
MQGVIAEGIVDCVVPGGEGIVRYQGDDIFISHVAAGDTVRFKIGDKRRGVWRAHLLQIISPSTQRIAAPCPVANDCGGCALQHLATHSQAALKSSWVEQYFAKLIAQDTNFIPIQARDEGFAGRRRVRWFIDNDARLGFHQRNSHDVITTSECLALSQDLDDLRGEVESQLHLLPPQVKSIQAVALSNGAHLVFEAVGKKPEHFQSIKLATEQVIQYWWRDTNTSFVKPLHKPVHALFDHISLQPYAASSIAIQIGVNDFIQGQQQGNQELITQILQWCEGSKRVVDLFSGCGNLSLPIAAAFSATVVGAELNPHSVQAANNNAQRLKLDASYETLDLFGKFNTEAFIGADTLIIDPPRKGAKHICRMMGKLFPQQIIMVHCDLASGARDGEFLKEQGYVLQTLRPLDLFPFTGHVEVMSLWATP